METPAALRRQTRPPISTCAKAFLPPLNPSLFNAPNAIENTGSAVHLASGPVSGARAPSKLPHCGRRRLGPPAIHPATARARRPGPATGSPLPTAALTSAIRTPLPSPIAWIAAAVSSSGLPLGPPPRGRPFLRLSPLSRRGHLAAPEWPLARFPPTAYLQLAGAVPLFPIALPAKPSRSAPRRRPRRWLPRAVLPRPSCEFPGTPLRNLSRHGRLTSLVQSRYWQRASTPRPEHRPAASAASRYRTSLTLLPEIPVSRAYHTPGSPSPDTPLATAGLLSLGYRLRPNRRTADRRLPQPAAPQLQAAAFHPIPVGSLPSHPSRVPRLTRRSDAPLERCRWPPAPAQGLDGLAAPSTGRLHGPISRPGGKMAPEL